MDLLAVPGRLPLVGGHELTVVTDVCVHGLGHLYGGATCGGVNVN